MLLTDCNLFFKCDLVFWLCVKKNVIKHSGLKDEILIWDKENSNKLCNPISSGFLLMQLERILNLPKTHVENYVSKNNKICRIYLSCFMVFKILVFL